MATSVGGKLTYSDMIWTSPDDEEIEGLLVVRLTPEGLIMDFIAGNEIVATQSIYKDDLAEMCV